MVRVDMLERLADLIRPLISWRKDKQSSSTQKTTTNNEPSDQAEPPTQQAKSDEAPQDQAKSDEDGKDKTPAPTTQEVPVGATGDGGFTIVPEMMSIMGCSAEELADVLQSVGYRATKKSVKAEAVEQTPGEDSPSQQEGQDQGSQETPEDTGVVEEIIIWRPRKRAGFHKSSKGGHKARAGKGGQKDGYKKGRGKGRGAQAKKQHRADRAKSYQSKAPQKMDPDSPFAKLQALKDQIEDKAG